MYVCIRGRGICRGKKIECQACTGDIRSRGNTRELFLILYLLALQSFTLMIRVAHDHFPPRLTITDIDLFISALE